MSPTASRSTLILASLAALTVEGCILRVPGAMVVSTRPAFRQPPTLVLVSPGLWVVEDYDQAVFFLGDSYWYCDGDVWYRSSQYSTGWAAVRIDLVPQTVRVVDRRRYVRYRPPSGIERRQARAEGPGRGGPLGHDDSDERRRGQRPEADDGGPGRGRGADRDDGRGHRPDADDAGGRVDDDRGRGHDSDDAERGRGHDSDDGERGRGRGPDGADQGRGGGAEPDGGGRDDEGRGREEKEEPRGNPGKAKGGSKAKGGKPKR